MTILALDRPIMLLTCHLHHFKEPKKKIIYNIFSKRELTLLFMMMKYLKLLCTFLAVPQHTLCVNRLIACLGINRMFL